MDIRSSSDLDFSSVVRINREIRDIVEISRQVSLSAMNAMLIARKAGEASRGFGVVSGELQDFARQLAIVMAQLSELMFRLLQAVARVARQRKMHGYLAQAGAGEVSAQPKLLAVVTAKQAEIAETQRLMNETARQIVVRIRDAQRLCQAGMTLSRAAKIEAVYGASYAGVLRQVSEQVETTIHDIAGTLKGLRTEMGTVQA